MSGTQPEGRAATQQGCHGQPRMYLRKGEPVTRKPPKSEEARRFEALAKRLVSVPKKEIARKTEEYEKAKQKRKPA